MLYKKIAEQITKSIDDGIYQIGEKIPSELDLAKQFNSSKATIRKALGLLVNKGYITSRRQSGYYVNSEFLRKSFASLSLNSLHQIYGKDRIYNRVLLITKTKADEFIADKLGVDYLAEVYFCSRIRYVDDVPIQLETVYMPVYLFPDLCEKYYSKSVYEYVERNYKIKYSFKKIKAGFIPKEYLKYVPNFENKPLLIVTDTSTLETGEIFEYSINYHFDEEFMLMSSR